MDHINMRQCRITVYNYRNEHGAPFKLNVIAQCVGGDTGVFAVFTMPRHPNLIGIAGGDDGHWQLEGVHGRAWIDSIIAAYQAVKSEECSDEDKYK